MYFQFNPEIAIIAGVHAAAVFEVIKRWGSNENEIKFIDNEKYSKWTANEIHSILPCLTVNQIRAALKKLESKNLIKKAYLNENKTDRTLWYCVVKEWL